MPAKLTTEQYRQRLAEKRPELKLVGEYEGCQKPVLHICPEGHLWEARPNNVLNGADCFHCEGKKKRTDAEYIAELEAKGNPMRPLEPYVSRNKKIKHKCPEGHEYDLSPAAALKSNGCKYCVDKRFFDWDAIYRQEVADAGFGVIVLGKYEGSGTPIKHRCAEGHEWNGTPSNMKKSIAKGFSGCGVCSGMRLEMPYEDWLAMYAPALTLLEPYQANYIPLLHRCSCGNPVRREPKVVMLKGLKTCHDCSDATYGFNPNKLAFLYIAKHKLKSGRIRVNVGVTNNAFKERYSKSDLETVLRVEVIEGEGHMVAALERSILERFSKCLDSKGLGLQKKVGVKECLKADYDEVLSFAREQAARGTYAA